MMILDSQMQPLPTQRSFRRSRSLNNLEMAQLQMGATFSLLDQQKQQQQCLKQTKAAAPSTCEDDTEATMEELFAPFGAFEDDEFLGASLTSSSSSNNPLDWTRHSEEERKKKSCAQSEVQYDCFGFPLFDLEAEAVPQVKLQVPVPVNNNPTSNNTDDAAAAMDAEKTARRARRRRSKHALQNQETPAQPAPVAPVPAVPHTPMRRRRSTGLLSSTAMSQTWHQDNATRTDSNSSAPTRLSSKRADGQKVRRRKSLGDGGIRSAMNASAHQHQPADIVPPTPEFRRCSTTNSLPKKSSPRGPRRSASSDDPKLSSDKKANRRRSSISQRRPTTSMSVSETGHAKRRSSMKASIMGSLSVPEHSHHQASPTSTGSGRRITVAVMEDVSQQMHANTPGSSSTQAKRRSSMKGSIMGSASTSNNSGRRRTVAVMEDASQLSHATTSTTSSGGTPDGSSSRREGRRSQRKEFSAANKRLDRSKSRSILKRQNSGPSLSISA